MTAKAADPALVYRDATFNRTTRDTLAAGAAVLARGTVFKVGGQTFDAAELRDAIADVVRRWDANDATEIVLTRPMETMPVRDVGGEDDTALAYSRGFTAGMDQAAGICTCGDPGDCGAC